MAPSARGKTRSKRSVHNGYVEIAEHIDALRQHGRLLADAAEQAGLDAAVPPCAPWRVKDLLRHTGYIHRWAAQHITGRPAQVLGGPPEEEILSGGAPDDELIAWFRDGHAALVNVLSAADPDLQTATFMAAPSPLAFWARRQAHETAIHRVDAQSPAGRLSEFPADFAVDGIDELIMGFGRRRKYQPLAAGNPAGGGGNLAGGGGNLAGTLRVLAAGTGAAWRADVREGRIQAQPESDPSVPADCTVSGPASGVYLYLWNRADAAQAGVTISGNSGILALWQSGVRVRWG
jgi:uncharacterized protein (TIGR03083 family)